MVESQIKTQEDIDKKITALKADPTQYTSELKKSIIIDITFSLLRRAGTSHLQEKHSQIERKDHENNKGLKSRRV